MDNRNSDGGSPAGLPAPRRDAMWPAGAATGQWPWWQVYTLAVVLTAATLIVRLALGFVIGDLPGLILFMIPIIISAYVGGLGPGLVATTVAALETDYFLLPPVHSFYITKGFNVL